MRKRFSSRFWYLLWVAVVLSATLLWLYLPVLGDRTRAHMMELRDGVVRYDIQHQQLPKTLAEVVEGGFLPQRSTIYRDPGNYRSPILFDCDYSQVEFDLEFTEKTFRVASKGNPHFGIDHFQGTILGLGTAGGSRLASSGPTILVLSLMLWLVVRKEPKRLAS